MKLLNYLHFILIFFLNKYIKQIYKMYSHTQANNFNIFKILNESITQITYVYFSDQNIDTIQNEIKSQIVELTETQIPKQNVKTILIIMKSIYLEFSNNICGNDVDTVVNQYNQKVIEYCVNNIHTNLLQKKNYIKDINLDENGYRRPRVPINFGQSTRQFKQLPDRDPF